MPEYTMTINGQAVNTEKTFGIVNPASGKVFAQCPQASLADVDNAVRAAQQAFASWRQDEGLRRECLKKAAETILENIDELARLLSMEQGKPIDNAINEIKVTAARFSHPASIALPVDILQDDAEVRVEVHRQPIGVVAAITPWNYPVSISAKVGVPLLVGNTVVVKPSPYTPLSTLRLGELLRDVFPKGVYNVISGTDDTGAWLTQHPLVRKISFTGSVPTGKAIAKVAADDLKRVTLELGGNDAAIVLEDVDPEKVAEKIFWGAFTNSGQVCIAIKRLYIHEKVYDAVVAELVKLANNVVIGDGLEPGTQLGPLNNEQQLKIVEDLVNDAKQHGADILTGGHRLERPGYFYPPTLISNIKEGSKLVDQEQFGPVLPIMKFSDVEEVIKRANSNSMGLGSSIWTSDWQRGAKLATRLESGVAWVNRTFATHPDAPFGGFKQSGVGREGGASGINAYSELQTVSVAKV